MNTLYNESKKLGKVILITPMQGIYVHGILNTRRTLSWFDIVDNSKMTAKYLLSLSLSPEELHHIQPDPHLWVQTGKVTGADVEALQSWPLHPIDHFKMDIGEFLLQRYPVRILKSLGISYDYLIDKLGMNFCTLGMFGYTWKDWVDLGLNADHVQMMTLKQVGSVFNIPCDNQAMHTAITKIAAYRPQTA
jgi:hypothetical protein